MPDKQYRRIATEEAYAPSELFRRCLQLYATMDEPVPADAETMLRIELATGARIVSLPGKEGTVRGCSGVDLLAIERRRSL